MSDMVSGKRLAKAFGLKSTRRLTDFTELGMPSRGVGKGKVYPLEDAFRWYLGYKVTEAKRQRDPADFSKARARKMEADARLSEIEVAKADEELITRSAYEQALGAICERMASVVNAAPSKYASRWHRAESFMDALGVLEAIRDETLAALRGDGNESDTPEALEV